MSGLLGGGAKTQSTTAPMEASLRIQTSAYGMAVPIVYGTTRVSANLMWYGAFTAHPHTTTTSGGKGGGGGSTSNTTYTYSASMILGLSEGQIVGVRKLWKDKDSYASNTLFTIKDGDPDNQVAWSYLTTKFPTQALTYRGIAYAAAANYDLGDSSSTPNHSFEVAGLLIGDDDATDAKPSEILRDYLTNPRYGAGFSTSYLYNWQSYYDYTVASGLLFSPAISSQTAAHEFVTLMAKLTNSGFYWSDGYLKVTPYGDQEITANGVTYTPNLTPIYELTDEDFIFDGSNDPVLVTRSANSDAYNKVQVEYLNRANQYNVEIAEAKDQANIELFGERPLDPIKAHEIADPAVARAAAQMILQRALYVRNTYEFSVGVRFALLEPTDYITITDTTLGLDQKPVRILSIEERDDYTFNITAEDAPAGVFSSATYDSPEGSGHQNDFNVPAGNTSGPVIFEAPAALATTANGLEVWIGASGGSDWGGCQVWVSYDGETYLQVADIGQPARQGVLTAALPAHSDPDTANTLSVNLSMSNGELLNASQTDADLYATLCYVGGELVSYANATLTGANAYNLTYLRRGAYGTAIEAHAINSQFLRVDTAVAKLSFTSDKIGQQIFIKLPAFNVYGAALQTLADVNPFTYTITGSALLSTPADVTNLLSNYNNFVGGLTTLYWDRVNDFRTDITYEVRLGTSWETGQVMTRTPITQYVVPTSGMYWVAARVVSEAGTVYSTTPKGIEIAQSALVSNVLATWDEESTGWSGTKSAGLVVTGGDLVFSSSGGQYTVTDGIYTLPSAHTINAGRVTPCNVLINYTAGATAITGNVLAMVDVFAVDDFLETTLGPNIFIQPQIAIAGADGVFGDWQNFVSGYYNAKFFKARVLLHSDSVTISPILANFVFSVDVPDRIDTSSLTTATGGSTVTYSAPFNGGANGLAVPAVQATIVGAQQGDDVQLTAQTLNGFTVKVINGGVGVARTVNWIAQGY
jgi:hypothetical protein